MDWHPYRFRFLMDESKLSNSAEVEIIISPTVKQLEETVVVNWDNINKTELK